MTIPSQFTAGDSVTWRTDGPLSIGGGVVVSTANWDMSTVLSGPSVLTVSAGPDAASWVSVISSAQSAELLPGDYAWESRVSNVVTGERKTILRGRLRVLADIATLPAGSDPRSLAEKALADAQAALAKYNGSGGKVRQYAVGGRSMVFADSQQILAEIDYWQRQVNNEQAKARIAAGKPSGRSVYVRFTL
jgi:inactivated superfamily I helicase